MPGRKTCAAQRHLDRRPSMGSSGGHYCHTHHFNRHKETTEMWAGMHRYQHSEYSSYKHSLAFIYILKHPVSYTLLVNISTGAYLKHSKIYSSWNPPERQIHTETAIILHFPTLHLSETVIRDWKASTSKELKWSLTPNAGHSHLIRYRYPKYTQPADWLGPLLKVNFLTQLSTKPQVSLEISHFSYRDTFSEKMNARQLNYISKYVCTFKTRILSITVHHYWSYWSDTRIKRIYA